MEMPLVLKLEKAKNELRFAVNRIAANYDLPGYVIDLVIEGILAEERQQRLSLMAEQITIDVDRKEGEEDGEHTKLP